MIVITSIDETKHPVQVGDKFSLRVCDSMGCQVILEETITVAKVIVFIACFRFAGAGLRTVSATLAKWSNALDAAASAAQRCK